MKIEMGESLLYSWLRHAKECQIVQTNWTTSPKWELQHEDLLEALMEKSGRLFMEKGVDVFKQNTLSQLLKQAEIDVMGMSFNSEGSPGVFAVDVAFHESGLNYGSKQETTARIVKKYLRAAFCVIGYLGLFDAELIFASPKVNPATLVVVKEYLEYLNGFFEREAPGFSARFLANDDFDMRILQPILLASEGVSDTNELFLRSYQLYGLFGSNARRIEHVSVGAGEPTAVNASSLSEIKIGRFVQVSMRNVLSKQLISDEEVEKLCDLEYSRRMFGIQFAMLKKLHEGEDPDAEARDQNMYRRYYSKLFEYKGEHLLLTNQWFERNRPGFEEWLNEKAPGFWLEDPIS